MSSPARSRLTLAYPSDIGRLWWSRGSDAVGSGGADRDRTGDPLLAKQVLSQLSYGPISRCQMTAARDQNMV